MRRTARACVQYLSQEVHNAIEAKPILASSPFAQRKAFLVALRADIIARRNEIIHANQHDCEAFTQQMQTGGATGVTPSSRGGGAELHAVGGDSGASPPPLPASPVGLRPHLEGAGPSSLGGRIGPRRDAVPLSTSSAGQETVPRQQQQPQRGDAANSVDSPGGVGSAPRTGGILGPFFHSAFTSRPSHRQRLSPLRFDKVFSVIDYLLDQPDPIAIPSDCWLSPHCRRKDRLGHSPGSTAGRLEASPSADALHLPVRSIHVNADPKVEVCEISVPLGLVGVLSRYRPRMCLDAITMGIFAGNALLLDGGASLSCTDAALMNCARRALAAVGLPATAVVHVESYDAHNRLTTEWLRMADRVDMGLVCGPPKLYEFACRNCSIPLLRATSRSCSLFVHESASYDTALHVIVNAKRQSPGAANAVTTLIMHSKFPRYVELLKDLVDDNIILLGDYPARGRAPECIHEIASDEEYRGLSQGLRDFSNTLCIKTVDSIDQALFFLDLFGSKQADGIIASDESVIAEFCTSADSAVVLVNASTRFSSGLPLGCGPDLAIATSKVHCRGPFTLSALTTRKFVVRAKTEEGAMRN